MVMLERPWCVLFNTTFCGVCCLKATAWGGKLSTVHAAMCVCTCSHALHHAFISDACACVPFDSCLPQDWTVIMRLPLPLKYIPACLQIPTVGFLYIAGYIGYVGRDYIKSVKSEKKPTEKEIIIDVPFAIKLAFQGIGWPFRAIQELRAGTLTEDDSKITVSPR